MPLVYVVASASKGKLGALSESARRSATRERVAVPCWWPWRTAHCHNSWRASARPLVPLRGLLRNPGLLDPRKSLSRDQRAQELGLCLACFVVWAALAARRPVLLLSCGQARVVLDPGFGDSLDPGVGAFVSARRLTPLVRQLLVCFASSRVGAVVLVAGAGASRSMTPPAPDRSPSARQLRPAATR